jgi:hypothetical protein
MHRTSTPASPNTKTDRPTYKLNGIAFDMKGFDVFAGTNERLSVN